MADEDFEKIPFLNSNDISVEFPELPLNFTTLLRRAILQSTTLLLFLTLLLSNGLWWINYTSLTHHTCTRPKLIYTPAISAIQYEKKTLKRSIGPENVYTGEPRQEHDNAWKDLIKPMAFKISAEELALLGEESTGFVDGSGYLAEMAVFHELHCIKRIRRHLHLNYYYGNLTNDKIFMDRERRHMDHCLEYWREAAMCRGDPTLTTFIWNEERGMPFSNVHSTHECVNWDRLYRWAESRMVDTSDVSQFTHSPGYFVDQ